MAAFSTKYDLPINQPVRRVGFKELNRNLYEYIKGDLPFIITKDKKPYAIVMPYAHVMRTIDIAENDAKPSLWQRIKRLLTMKIA